MWFWILMLVLVVAIVGGLAHRRWSTRSPDNLPGSSYDYNADGASNPWRV